MSHPRRVPEEKNELHPRNKHRDPYDFQSLIRTCPELAEHVSANAYNSLSIDFKNPHAVRALNRSLLMHFYNVRLWDIPEGYLCPPIPGRADYLHYLADLLKGDNQNIPVGKTVRILDIGTGANCVYPLIGHAEYGWTFVGSEIDHVALRSAKNIVEVNLLSKAISIRKQQSAKIILNGIVHSGERFDALICNPPFHASLQESLGGSARKWKNLGLPGQGAELNFGGRNAELWCEGGELAFVTQMIRESVKFQRNVSWFTSLISKKENLSPCYRLLKALHATDVKTITMSQGHKISRILSWTFS
jgi:23S rRNA (adenine1618-N6)-methyltransferase